jgi:hexokinase
MQGMGKGFLASHGLLGKDLGDVIQQACARRNLKVQLNAIVNDSSATLLSTAYSDPSTRYGLILGTGVNIAVHLPVGAFTSEKFGVRPSSWHDAAKHVIVNTELGMFGKGLLPMTKWDVHLNATHILPDFQPFEHLVSGRYLGEIARLIILDAIRDVNLLNGDIPPSLEQPYSLDTALLAHMQSSSTYREARDLFSSSHPNPNLPTESDIRIIRSIAVNVSERACAILAAAIHGLWQLRNDAENGAAHLRDHTVMACNGSVIQNYPSFQATCQRYLNVLVEMTGGSAGSLELTSTMESSLLGAAVAVACIDGGKMEA